MNRKFEKEITLVANVNRDSDNYIHIQPDPNIIIVSVINRVLVRRTASKRNQKILEKLEKQDLFRSMEVLFPEYF